LPKNSFESYTYCLDLDIVDMQNAGIIRVHPRGREDTSAEVSEGMYRSNSNELDAGRKILKYTLCGDYDYACGKGAESIFLLIYPSHPERLCGATDEI